jgi:hypothetical protein
MFLLGVPTATILATTIAAIATSPKDESLVALRAWKRKLSTLCVVIGVWSIGILYYAAVVGWYGLSHERHRALGRVDLNPIAESVIWTVMGILLLSQLVEVWKKIILPQSVRSPGSCERGENTDGEYD